MNNYGTVGAERSSGIWYRLREAFRNLFKKKIGEARKESAEEGRWDDEYREEHKINFAEIFANRLANYTLSGSEIACDEPTVAEALDKAVAKWYKWTQMAYGVGRVFLIPYVIGDTIYTDVIPQGRAWTTKMRGDDVIGIGVVADVRFVGREMYTRLTSYEWDPDSRVFEIENKAVRRNGAEVPLSIMEEWASIEPYIAIQGADRPLFAFVDCPKDNRRTDSPQGAPITFGCDETIAEIRDCISQYGEEFDLKQTWLGVDRAMLDKNGQPDKSKLYKTFIGKNTESLFEIFSPDIRDASYRSRLLDLFARLEKQVGTSSGILTPAETANATATQVRRSMYDTLSIVGRMRNSIENAVDTLGYIYTVYLRLLGRSYSEDYTITKRWSDEMIQDKTERFGELMQAHSSGAVKTSEVRQFVFPDETAEEAEAAVKEIEESRPDPVVPDFFGE